MWEEEVLSGSTRLFRCSPSLSEVLLGRQLAGVLQQGAYDCVHSHIFNLSGWLLRHAAQAKVPIRIAHYHNTHDGCVSTPARRLRRLISRAVATRYATDVIACSTDALRLAPKAGGSNCVLHYGIQALKPASTNLRTDLGIAASTPLVLHAGRFYPQKNHHFLLQVFHLVNQVLPEAHLVLMGDGPLLPAMRESAQKMGLQHRIHFLGNRSDARGLLSQGDAFCFPSSHEGYAIALVEARFAGLPVVASDLPVLRESADGAQAVELVPLSEPRVFAEALLNALGRGHVEAPISYREYHSASASSQRLLQLYRTLASRQPEPEGAGVCG